MMTNALRRMGWIGILTAAVAAVPVRGEAPDAAGLVPADAAIFVGWSQINDGKWELIDLARAVAYAPLLEQEMKDDVRVVRTIVELADLVTRHTGALYFPAPVNPSDSPLGQFGTVVVAGKDSPAIEAAIKTMQMKASGNDALKRVAIDGVTFSTIAADGYLLWGIHKEQFVIASSEAVAKAIIACLNGGKSLKDSAGLAAARAKTGGSAAGWYLTVYGDMTSLLKSFAAMGSADDVSGFEQVSKALALDALKTYYLHFDHVDYGVRTTAYVSTAGPRRGLLKLYDQKPLTDDDLQVVPKDAYFASISNVDLNALWVEAKKIIEQTGPENLQQVEGAVAMTRQYLGFSITEDLLPNLGDTYALFDAPEHGGLLFTGAVLVAETKDAAAFQNLMASFVRSMTGLAAPNNIKVTVQELKDGGHTVHYVLIGGWPIPVAPAWGFVGDRVVFGLAPQTVATAMRQVDAKTRGESLLASADFKAARALLPKSPSALSYVDVRNSYRVWYALKLLVQTAGASMSVGTPQAYDLAKVPGFPADFANERNMVSAYTADGDGILFRSVGSSPVAMLSGGDGGASAAAVMVSILLPSLSRARETALETVVISNLRGLGVGCHVWASDNAGAFPGSLTDLVQNGTISPQLLINPRGDTPELYEYVTGQRAGSPATNVLVFERPSDQAQVAVLFVDGHVERLPVEVLEKALRATYEQLGREGEFPAQLFPSTDTDD